MYKTFLALVLAALGVMLAVYATLQTSPFILVAGSALVVLAVQIAVYAGRSGE